jgi:hypothetical protein
MMMMDDDDDESESEEQAMIDARSGRTYSCSDTSMFIKEHPQKHSRHALCGNLHSSFFRNRNDVVDALGRQYSLPLAALLTHHSRHSPLASRSYQGLSHCVAPVLAL